MGLSSAWTPYAKIICLGTLLSLAENGFLSLHVTHVYRGIAGHSFGLWCNDCVPWKEWEGYPSRTPGCSWGNPVVCHPWNARRSPEHWAGWTLSPVLERSPELGTQFSPGPRSDFQHLRMSGQPSKNRLQMTIFSWMWLLVEVWGDQVHLNFSGHFVTSCVRKASFFILRSLKWLFFLFYPHPKLFLLFHPSATHISNRSKSSWPMVVSFKQVIHCCALVTVIALICQVTWALHWSAKFRGSQNVKQNNF